MKTLRHNHGEQGQTIVLVALSLLALLSMAALAIDVANLYVASTEAQQAADAAALAGAKVFVTSGYTSYPAGFGNNGWVCNGSTGLADYAAQSALAANTVAGVTPTMTTSCDFTQDENPTITVRVQRTGLPIFFARIWQVSSPSVSATAKAEAYNPSGGSAPIASGLKPWLLPNCNPFATTAPTNANCSPSPYSYFIDPTDGSIVNAASFIGQTITLNLGSASQLTVSSPPATIGFYALDLPQTPAPLCPSSSPSWCSNNPGIYYDGIACFNPTQLSCGESVNGPSDPVYVDPRMNTGFLKGRTSQATQCLIHASGLLSGQGQDSFISPGVGKPVLIQPGINNPDSSLAGAQYISRSDSVVTVPLFNGINLCPGGRCNQTQNSTIVGFLQLGIIQDDGVGNLDALILNASGCNPSASGQTVTGGNISSIPVRLVQSQ